jgi:hypothetical protein
MLSAQAMDHRERRRLGSLHLENQANSRNEWSVRIVCIEAVPSNCTFTVAVRPGGSGPYASVGPPTSNSLAHLDLSKILSLASSPWVGVDMGECSSTPLGGFGWLALASWRRSRSSLASEGCCAYNSCSCGRRRDDVTGSRNRQAASGQLISISSRA